MRKRSEDWEWDWESSVAMGPDNSASLTESNDVKFGYLVRVVFDPQDCNRHWVLMEGLLWRAARRFRDPALLNFNWAKQVARIDLVQERKEREKRRGVRRAGNGRFC